MNFVSIPYLNYIPVYSHSSMSTSETNQEETVKTYPHLKTYMDTLFQDAIERQAQWAALRLKWDPITLNWADQRLENYTLYRPGSSDAADGIGGGSPDVAHLMVQFTTGKSEPKRGALTGAPPVHSLVGLLRSTGDFQKVVIRRCLHTNYYFVPLTVFGLNHDDDYKLAGDEMIKHKDFFYPLTEVEKEAAKKTYPHVAEKLVF